MDRRGIKQVIVVRKDLKLTRGKMSAQASHASLQSYIKTFKKYPRIARTWLKKGGKKVIVYVSDRRALLALNRELPSKIPKALITDAGMTHLKPGTITCLGIGPFYEDELDKYTRKLKLVG